MRSLSVLVAIIVALIVGGVTVESARLNEDLQGLGVFLGRSPAVKPSPSQQRQPIEVRRIGYVGSQNADWPAPLDRPRREVFREALRDNGYVEGENLVIEYRFAEGRSEALPALVGELVTLGVEAILLADSAAVRPAAEVTTAVPLVMAISSDPIISGRAEQLGRPGRNVTGQSMMFLNLTGKRFELMADTLREARSGGPLRVGVLFIGREGGGISAAWREAEEVGAELGMELTPLSVRNAADLAPAFAVARDANVEAVFAFGSAFLNDHNKTVAQLSREHGLPLFSSTREWVLAGALQAYAPPFPAMFRRAARQMAEVLQGAGPSDLPIEQPTKFDLILNMTTASSLGLDIPDSVLTRADEFVQ